MNKIIIAIDGYSSCGKSTIAKSLAEALDYIFIDTGAMYRAVTYFFLKNNIDVKDAAAVEKALEQISISFQKNENKNETYLNGENVEKAIRTMEVSSHVSPVAAVSAVRRAMVAQQQAIGVEKGVVMDGRDIGTVVFPDAEMKLFVTADPDIRAQRRHVELLKRGEQIDIESVKANLLERDEIDSNRADSPLRQAEDAIVLDTSHMTMEEQLDTAFKMVKQKIIALSY